MNENEVEGGAIANLIAADEETIVGLVYRWTTGALAIRWDMHGPQRVLKIFPDLCDADKAEIDFASLTQLPENGGAKVGHGSGGMSLLRAV